MNKNDLPLQYSFNLPEQITHPLCVSIMKNGINTRYENAFFIVNNFTPFNELELPCLDVYNEETIIPFTFKGNKLPLKLYKQILKFFKDVYNKHKSEALCEIVWDKVKKEYYINIPKQDVSGGFVRRISDENDVFDNNKILIMDIHSHNVMNAFWSGTDNNDEQSLRFFGVIGNILEKEPSYKMRFKYKDIEKELEISDIFDNNEPQNDDYPKEWMDKVIGNEIIPNNNLFFYDSENAKNQIIDLFVTQLSKKEQEQLIITLNEYI